jgi:hypothetical protein
MDHTSHNRIWGWIAWVGCGLGGCGGEASAFIQGAVLEPCVTNVPVCQQTAGCIMGEGKYIEGDFPGGFNFVVTTPQETEITVELLFSERKHPGEELIIIWYEVGCHESLKYSSLGKDIFQEAGADLTLSQTKRVTRPGDHLVDVTSDAITHYYARVVITPPE